MIMNEQLSVAIETFEPLNPMQFIPFILGGFILVAIGLIPIVAYKGKT